MTRTRPAAHRTILVVDVEGFGDRRRNNPQRVAVRDGLYFALEKALLKVGISLTECHHEGCGDGVFVLVPPDVPKGLFVEEFPHALADALRKHNEARPCEERIRLRMALNAGEINFDDHGVTAAAINLAFRLLDAEPLKLALADSPGVLAMIASDWFFDEVIRHSAVADPTTYRPVLVKVKETTTTAWICRPDHPYPTTVTSADVTSPPPPIRVVVADDAALVRDGLVRLIERAVDMEVVGTAAAYDELLAVADECVPDVVVTDIRMPPSGTDEGLRAATELRRRHPGMGVVVLSQWASPNYALRLLDEGAAGRAYLLKEKVSDVDELLAAVRTTAAGGSSIDPEVIDLVVSARQHAVRSPLAFLTAIEKRIKRPPSRQDASPTAVRVLLVDDQDAFRRAARAVIERTAGFVLVAEAAHAEVAFAAVRATSPDLVLMDIGLAAGVDGIEATRSLLRRHPGLVVVLLSTYERADLPAAARACGATTYLPKHELSPALLRAVWDRQPGAGH